MLPFVYNIFFMNPMVDRFCVDTEYIGSLSEMLMGEMGMEVKEKNDGAFEPTPFPCCSFVYLRAAHGELEDSFICSRLHDFLLLL